MQINNKQSEGKSRQVSCLIKIIEKSPQVSNARYRYLDFEVRRPTHTRPRLAECKRHCREESALLL